MVKLNLDTVPSTLEGAVKMIVEALDEEEIAFIHRNESCAIHHGFGRSTRNNWSLWDRETPLVRHFLERFNIGHADDISGMLMDCTWKSVKGEPWELEKQVERYHTHWKACGLPENGIPE
tara:strand:- start:43056 stop:43415 length:360 start_codon:yes stop_codon:yes gene_type:complete